MKKVRFVKVKCLAIVLLLLCTTIVFAVPNVHEEYEEFTATYLGYGQGCDDDCSICLDYIEAARKAVRQGRSNGSILHQSLQEAELIHEIIVARFLELQSLTQKEIAALFGYSDEEIADMFAQTYEANNGERYIHNHCAPYLFFVSTHNAFVVHNPCGVVMEDLYRCSFCGRTRILTTFVPGCFFPGPGCNPPLR